MREIQQFQQGGRSSFHPKTGATCHNSPALDCHEGATYNFSMTGTDSRTSNGFDGLHANPRAWLLGVVYWLAFLMVLEPGNIFGSGGKLTAGHEILRITAATLLGTSVTPLILTLVRRFPVEGGGAWRHAAIQFAASLALSAVLIVISCLLADWLHLSGHPPFRLALRVEFQHNWSLVAFCIVTLIGFAHTPFARHILGTRQIRTSPAPQPQYLSSLPLKVRGELVCVQLSNVDWIEAQGNYLALHEGSETRLVRENLGAIETKLDPRKFVRVHRGAIVSLGRIEGMSPLGSGDASLRLASGAELRLSRKYRGAFLAAWRDYRAQKP